MIRRLARLGWIIGALCACTDSAPPPPVLDMQVPPVDAGFGAVRPPALLLGIWSDGTEYWIAGGTRGDNGGVLLRGRDVLRYAPIPSGPALWWIWGHGDHRWAVGEAGRVLRYDGATWRSEETQLADSAVLWGVWGSGPNDVWAVGGSPRPGGPKGIVLRSDGDGQWRQIADAVLPETNLYKAWGSGPNDVHIVGEAGVALHWDGAGLRRVPTPTTDLIFTVHGRPDGVVLATGGTTNGIVLRWTGTEWVDDGAPAGQPPFNGVYVRPDGTAIVSGQRGRVIERSLDGSWRRVDVPLGAPGDTLHAVWAEQSTWLVGGDFFGDAGGWILTDAQPTPQVEGAPPPVPDAGVEAGMLDARLPDIGVVDAMIADAAPVDAAPMDAGLDAAPDAHPVDALPDAALDAGVDARIAVCGDGRVDAPETCDDGNQQIGDGCDATCAFECGNSRLDPGEACEDGNRETGDGCDADCQRECGNGTVEGMETCDDGNRDRDDGCDRFCQLECGNGQLDGVETCDDGARMGGDGCDADCQLECGNGQVEGDEECDDGNRRDDDGCDRVCREQRQPGPGDLCPNLVCDEALALECWGVADLNFENHCLRPCDAVEECFADFGADACCQPPGPQLLETFCIPRDLLRDPCGE